MNCKIFKVLHTYTNKKGIERTFTQLVLVFPNGTVLYIQPNAYLTNDGIKVSNYKELCALASKVNDKADVKYE